VKVSVTYTRVVDTNEDLSRLEVSLLGDWVILDEINVGIVVFEDAGCAGLGVIEVL